MSTKLSDQEVDQLAESQTRELVMALKRYEATGRVPEGVKLARAPTLPPNPSYDDRVEYTLHKKEVLFVLAERYYGKVNDVWNYEIIIRNDGSISVDLKYIGDLSSNVREIRTNRVWIGQ